MLAVFAGCPTVLLGKVMAAASRKRLREILHLNC